MKCRVCGRELPDGAVRCPGCGAPQDNQNNDTQGRGLMDALSSELNAGDEYGIGRGSQPQQNAEYGGRHLRHTDDDRVDEFISQIEDGIGRGDEIGGMNRNAGEHPPAGADMRYGGGNPGNGNFRNTMWIKIGVAGAFALIALVLAVVLIARSCSIAAAGPGPSPSGSPEPTAEPSPGEVVLELDVGELELERGDTYKISLTLSPAGANGEFEAPVWESSDPEVATVDSYGVVTAVGEGDAEITVSAGGGTASCKVSVAENEFSEWVSELPAGISSAEYDIESARFYRFREKELTTSTESELEGWTVYESNTVAGEYGEWSEWQTTPVSANQTREVETRTEYSSRTLLEGEQYGEWGEWSYWSPNRQTADDGTLEENTRTTYRYFYYVCPKCGTRSPVNYCTQPGCLGEMSEDDIVEAWSDISYAEAVRYEWDGGARYTGTEKYYRTVIDRSAYFFEDVSNDRNVRTEYQYRTRSHIPEKWSEWSEWDTAEPESAPDVEVRSRTVYRSRTMALQSLNYFWRWGEWSEPVAYDEGAESFESGEDIEFMDLTLYRYREK